MRLSPQGLRKNNGVGIAKAKEEEFQERKRDSKVKCSRAQGRELVNLGLLLPSTGR